MIPSNNFVQRDDDEYSLSKSNLILTPRFLVFPASARFEPTRRHEKSEATFQGRQVLVFEAHWTYDSSHLTTGFTVGAISFPVLDCQSS